MPRIVHDEPNHLVRIDQVWMVISVDEHGNEGVVAAPYSLAGEIMPLPLIAADPARLQSIREVAVKVARVTGKQLRLIRLYNRVELEVIVP